MWRDTFKASRPLNAKAWTTTIICTHHPEGARSNKHWDEIGRFIGGTEVASFPDHARAAVCRDECQLRHRRSLPGRVDRRWNTRCRRVYLNFGISIGKPTRM